MMVVCLMTNVQSQKLRSITFTSGSIKDLAPEYEVVKIRGSVSIHQDVQLKRITSHGYSTFHSKVKVDHFQNSGSCIMKSSCEAMDVVNAGNLKMYCGKVSKIMSSGRLAIERTFMTEEFDSVGIIRAEEIQAKQFQLKLSGESKIVRLIAGEVSVEKDKISFPLLKKILVCQDIKGKNIQISYTEADRVEGDIVVIGKHCQIHTLYYTESYSISPHAEVQHIIRRESSW